MPPTEAPADPTSYGRRIADIYDSLYAATLPTDPAVARMAELAEGGAVLELGIGTGRLALPLAARGVEVHGVDSSPDMVEQLHAKPGGKDIPVVIGDFATVRMERRFRLVALAFNTIVAAPSQQAQVDVFRTAAAHLEPGGAFVLDTWVPDPAAFRRGQGAGVATSVRVVSLSEDLVLLEAAEIHPADQTMRTTKVLLTDAGPRLLPANHRYVWPAELDLMAQLAGLTLEQRTADWQGSPFTDDSVTHVSVYRAPR